MGEAWELLVPEQARIAEWVERDRLQLRNIHGKRSNATSHHQMTAVSPNSTITQSHQVFGAQGDWSGMSGNATPAAEWVR